MTITVGFNKIIESYRTFVTLNYIPGCGTVVVLKSWVIFVEDVRIEISTL